MEKILVKHSGAIELQAFDDKNDGHLFIGEGMKQVPFEIKRFYFINKLSHSTAIRGKHAHKAIEQYIFCINGSFELDLDDGTTTQMLVMNNPRYGVRLGAGLWHTMKNFSDDCIILVVASAPYDESDYIRDYGAFTEWVKAQRI